MEYTETQKENEWLALLENAIKEGFKIQINHRFKYKNKNLGTFLVAAKRSNKKYLIQKIEALGVNFKMHSREPEHYVEKFILQLSEDKKPNRQKYITRFNRYVLPKKKLLKKETITEINQIWQQKFGDIRKWKQPENDAIKVEKWKKFRYNEKHNPEEKWFNVKTKMGKLYSWVYTRKQDAKKMDSIWEKFTDKEKNELILEGFKTTNNN